MTATPVFEARTFWNRKGRLAIFLLASTSILCLLTDFYGLCSMRLATVFIFLPAAIMLGTICVVDGLWGNHRGSHAILIGLLAGLSAAVAYDIFRLPFVFSKEWGLDSIVPSMKLFKVFPRFGSMILGQSIEQPSYSAMTQIVGWIYHFSNGTTFGVMYLAIIGDGARRHWAWAIPFAVALELGMLFTPYSTVFNIPVTTRFVVVTMAAHAVFGFCLGLSVRWLSLRTRPDLPVRAAMARD